MSNDTFFLTGDGKPLFPDVQAADWKVKMVLYGLTQKPLATSIPFLPQSKVRKPHFHHRESKDQATARLWRMLDWYTAREHEFENRRFDPFPANLHMPALYLSAEPVAAAIWRLSKMMEQARAYWQRWPQTLN